MARRDHPLYRDTERKMLGGVCSGLGRYFDVDTTVVRIVFVVLALIGGGGVLAYVLLWIVVSPAPPGYWERVEDVPGGAADPDAAQPGEGGSGPGDAASG